MSLSQAFKLQKLKHKGNISVYQSSFDLLEREEEREEATERDFLKNKIADHFLYYLQWLGTYTLNSNRQHTKTNTATRTHYLNVLLLFVIVIIYKMWAVTVMWLP